MAPLHIMHYLDPKIEEEEDWKLFRRQLVECHRMGIDAITVDVWWGSVEKEGNNIFDWEYYHKIFAEIISQDLDIIPILSFHSFDPGPESAFRAPVPDWVWSYLAHESGLKIIDLKYVSEDLGENGNPLYSNEFVSLWVDDWVMPQYIEFMEEFLNEFQNYLQHFQEINISCGPTGELRYPSYNSHDGGKYPNRGRMQCYSDPAIQDYADWLKKVNEGLTPYQKRSRLPHTTLLLNEEIVHIPLFFAGVNIPKNKIIHDLVRSVDIFPTIFNILGIDDSTLKDKDGRSLVPMVEDKKLPELPAYFITNAHKEITLDDKVGIRTSKYKYFRASIDQEKEINLYELENDHQENNNIASENPEIVKEMEGILEKLTKNVTIDESEKLTEDQEKIIEKQLKEMGYI